MTKEIIAALSANDTDSAKRLLLEKFQGEVGASRSWDSPYYDQRVREVQEGIHLLEGADSRFTYVGLENLRDRYVLRDADGAPCETPQDFYARVAAGVSGGDAALAQRLYDYMARHWYSPATPVLMNAGTTKGLTISCFGSVVPDTLHGIFDAYKENAFLAKYGGGIGCDFSSLRGTGAKLEASGLESSGVIPFLKIMDSATIAVARNGVRRGAAAVYLRVDHPDIEEFMEMRKPTGDQDRRCLNLNHAVIITDEFMKAVEVDGEYDLVDPHFGTVTKKLKAKEVWRKLLMLRAETGEPYVMFVDAANRALAPHHREKGLTIRHSQLCSEIFQPSNEERTYTCCLSSLNLETFDEWEPVLESVVRDVVTSLDNNIDLFLRDARPEQRKAVFASSQERSVGLGVMGYHGYLMSKRIPFESITARTVNRSVFSRIGDAAKKASRELAVERGPCPDGGDQRNSYVMAIAPTASISLICGGATPGIEPMAGNAFVQKTLSGSFLVKNRYLSEVLSKHGRDDHDTWMSVVRAKGSVQHLDFLTDDERAAFRTAYEINQRELVQQAADRQPHVCQGQSLNLFFHSPVSGKYLNDVHMLAWRTGLKSLYYLRSESPIDSGIPQRDLANEECTVCQ